DARYVPLTTGDPALDTSVRSIAGSGSDGLGRLRAWVATQPAEAYRRLDEVAIGPAVPDPGAIYTVGLNYHAPGEPAAARPARPLIYGKAPSSVAGHGAVLTWDRTLTANVDPECELGVVIGAPATAVGADEAMRHVFGYTCINDVSSRDEWLDGDQWLLGKSIAGFCPVGPSVVTSDEVVPEDLRLGCTLNGVAIQDGSTSQMRFSIADVISYVSHHVELRPGDLIATGTPARLAGPPGPERHLRPGDEVTVWIEHIGKLTTTIA
ncbi:MAG: fumarylacetoacetate hydrolase family protein, partial [Chloroflexota bacterium]|nr:fumarylacetoacetate hydrolase family protein [Chloroflexota bacterium]